MTGVEAEAGCPVSYYLDVGDTEKRTLRTKREPCGAFRLTKRRKCTKVKLLACRLTMMPLIESVVSGKKK